MITAWNLGWSGSNLSLRNLYWAYSEMNPSLETWIPSKNVNAEIPRLTLFFAKYPLAPNLNALVNISCASSTTSEFSSLLLLVLSVSSFESKHTSSEDKISGIFYWSHFVRSLDFGSFSSSDAKKISEFDPNLSGAFLKDLSLWITSLSDDETSYVR